MNNSIGPFYEEYQGTSPTPSPHRRRLPVMGSLLHHQQQTAHAHQVLTAVRDFEQLSLLPLQYQPQSVGSPYGKRYTTLVHPFRNPSRRRSYLFSILQLSPRVCPTFYT